MFGLLSLLFGGQDGVARLGYAAIIGLIIFGVVCIAKAWPDYKSHGYRDKTQRAMTKEDLEQLLREKKEADEKAAFIDIYKVLFDADDKTAEHAYKNTDKAVREAVIKQYAGGKS